MNRCLHVGLALLSLAYAGGGMAADWRMEPAASRLEFTATYQGEPAPGQFKQFDTKLRFDPARPAKSELVVTVALTSFDMGSAELNEAVRGPEWFDLARFTRAEFRSTDIKPAGADRYVARGTLILKGTQRPIEVPFRWKADGKHATMAGEIALDRTVFGVGTGEWATGDPIAVAVKVNFSVQLRPAS
ncbi:MAG TPA: YceI family protein [Burkholderiales bacterium]